MFSELSLHRLLVKAVGDLGFSKPTAVQREAIPLALEGCDLKVESETGSGKTAAYLLPTLNRLLASAAITEGVRALVLLPTRELAQQVFEQCTALMSHTNLTSSLVLGGEGFEEQAASLSEDPAIVIATTGRLLEHVEVGSVDLGALEVLVLDEADRMLDMGFANDVLAIANATNSDRQTMLFSATLSNKWLPSVATKILKEPETLIITEEQVVLQNIEQQVILSDDQSHKLEQLLWLLRYEQYEKAIVFANNRDKAELVCNFLLKGKRRAAVLHGEIDSIRRKRVMEQMRNGKVDVLVATDVAARGLDITAVGLVVNFDMPRRADSYTHRVGRTGRGGRKGLAVSLISPLEWNLKASIERFLKRKFKPRTIQALKATFTGPKKLKASGEAYGKKPKKKTKKASAKTKKRLRDKKNIGKRRRPASTSSTESD